MTVYLHWRDLSFPEGDGEHANIRRAAYETTAEAVEQAAHDLAFQGAEIAGIVDEDGNDVLARDQLVVRAQELVDEHHGRHAIALETQLEVQRAHVASVKADIERRAA